MARRFYPSDCVSLNPTSVLSRVLVATVLGKKKENAAWPFIPIKTIPFISGSALKHVVVGENISNIAFNMKYNIECCGSCVVQ